MYLADACALIVFRAVARPERIMPRAASIMRANDVFVSPVTIWEITRKVAIGKLSPLWTPPATLGSSLRAQGYAVQPFTWDDAQRASTLPSHHKDPMDRMLIATALNHGLTILTDDVMFAAYGVTTVW